MFDCASFRDLLGSQFENGLEEIEVKTQVSIDTLQEIILGGGLEAVIANEMAYHRPVFLFNVSLIVLVIGSRTGESDLLVLTNSALILAKS